MDQEKNLGIVDTIVFVAMLLASSCIGIVFAYRDRNKATTSNYFFGERKMNPVPVAFSLSVTYLSALSMTALPAEAYIIGNSQVVGVFGMLLSVVLAIVYFIPAHLRLDVGTVYEFLELRFNATVRRMSVVLVTLTMIIYVGMNIYLPSLTVSAVTSLSFDVSVVVCTIICTFYTTVGGMKTVIWTDALQAIVMIFGLVSVFFKTLYDVGGLENFQDALDRGERSLLTKPNYDIRSRTAPLSIFLNMFCLYLYALNFTQPIVQRYQSCRNVRAAQWATAIFVLPSMAIFLISIGCGCIMYAYFEGCDPVKSGKLRSLDQGTPYLAAEVFKNVPGMAGLFVAAIFSASLSTVSSAINSLSVMFVRDIVPIWWTNLSQRVELIIGKITVVALGGIVMTIAYIFPFLQSNITKIIVTVWALCSGPLLGLFLLGFLCPWANSTGSVIGATTSLAFTFWAMIGSMFFKTVPHFPLPPTSTEFCPVNISYNITPTALPSFTALNFTQSTLSDGRTDAEPESPSYTFDQMVYSISFVNYMPIATTITIILGIAISFLTGRNDPAKMDPKLFIPLVDNSIIPEKVRKFFRFGVPELKDEQRQMRDEDLKVELQDMRA